MTGADIKLTDEQVELVHRLQRGQFGDVHFNPYEVGSRCAPALAPSAGWPRDGQGRSRCHTRPCLPQPAVDFFSHEVMIHPVTNRPADKRSFIPSLIEKEKVRVRQLLAGAGSTKPS